MGNSTWGVAGRLRGVMLCGALIALASGGCLAEDELLGPEEVNSHASALASEGRWELPAEVGAAGDMQHVAYTGAGAWAGEDSCEGGMTLGAETLRDYLYEYFPQLSLIGGYACRHINGNESQTSVHATGRALDLHIPLAADGAADNDLGDPLAHWLIRNAETIGIQFIIWDRSSWNASRPAGEKFRAYGGASPHRDHLHIELSLSAAAEETPWFDEEFRAPEIEECATLGAKGGILDDLGGCTQILGPTSSWRHELGEGHGDSLFWTNAFEGAEPSNWARWQIQMEEAGLYELEVYVAPEFGVFQSARYELVHAGEAAALEIDQSAADGWHSLGQFQFRAGIGQHLALFDNSDQEVAEGQRLAVDAIRLTRIADAPPPEPEPDAEVGNVIGGCQSSGGSSSFLAFLLVALALLRMRARSLPQSEPQSIASQV